VVEWKKQVINMTLSTLKIGKQEYVVVPRKDFERMRRKADLLSDQDATDLAESLRRLADPKEKRIPWDQVKKRAGLA
jgi:cytochrome c553